MAAILRWFGKLMGRLNCCKKHPKNVTQISDNELQGIYFWEDIVSRPKFKFKAKLEEGDTWSDCKTKNEDRLTEDFQQKTAESKNDYSNPVSNTKTTEVDMTNLQTADVNPKTEEIISEDSTDIPTQNFSTESEKEHSYQLSEEHAALIDKNLSQIETALKLKSLVVIQEPVVEHAIEPFVPQSQVHVATKEVEIQSQVDVEMNKNREQEAQPEEEFHAMDIWLEEDKEPLNGPWNLIKTFEGMDDLFVANPDILVIVKGEQFHVHQEVLRANSLYFEQRLSGKGKTQCVLQIDSEYISTEAFKTILHFLYDNHLTTSCQVMPHVLRASIYLGIENGVNECQKILGVTNTKVDNALKRYATAWEWDIQLENVQSSESFGKHFDQVVIKNDYLDLTKDQLKQLCNHDFIQSKRYDTSKCIEQKPFFDDLALKPKVVLLSDEPLTLWNIDVSSNNFGDAIYLDATTFKMDLEQQIAKSLDVLALNFEKVITKNDYIHLSKDQVLKFFSTDTIQARSEIIVLLGALKWIEHDYLQREESAVDLLNCVRFFQMTAKEIMACYHPPKLMGLVKLPEVQNILHKSLQYIHDKAINQEQLFKNPPSKTRTLLLMEKPLGYWEMSACDPEFYSEKKSKSTTEFPESEKNHARKGYAQIRTQLPNIRANFQEKKKTHISRFIDIFEEDFDEDF